MNPDSDTIKIQIPNGDGTYEGSYNTFLDANRSIRRNCRPMALGLQLMSDLLKEMDLIQTDTNISMKK